MSDRQASSNQSILSSIASVFGLRPANTYEYSRTFFFPTTDERIRNDPLRLLYVASADESEAKIDAGAVAMACLDILEEGDERYEVLEPIVRIGTAMIDKEFSELPPETKEEMMTKLRKACSSGGGVYRIIFEFTGRSAEVTITAKGPEPTPIQGIREDLRRARVSTERDLRSLQESMDDGASH